VGDASGEVAGPALHSDREYGVRCAGGLPLTTDVTKALGIGDEAERLGIVFEWAAHNGYNRSDLWEWLRKVQA